MLDSTFSAFTFPLETRDAVHEIGLYDTAQQFRIFPDTLVFPLPAGNEGIPFAEEYDGQYRQLVCWCNYARFWYYVVGTGKFPDEEYDFIEALVAKFEYECGLTSRYSPTKRVGSDKSIDYPFSIQRDFHLNKIIEMHPLTYKKNLVQ